MKITQSFVRDRVESDTISCLSKPLCLLSGCQVVTDYLTQPKGLSMLYTLYAVRNICTTNAIMDVLCRAGSESQWSLLAPYDY